MLWFEYNLAPQLVLDFKSSKMWKLTQIMMIRGEPVGVSFGVSPWKVTLGRGLVRAQSLPLDSNSAEALPLLSAPSPSPSPVRTLDSTEP